MKISNIDSRNGRFSSSFIVLSLLLVGLVFVPLIGCKNKNIDKMPDTANARVEQMTSHIPASTDVVFIAGDLTKTRVELNNLHNRVGQLLPVARLIQQQVQNDLGINILNEEGWTQAGINAKGGFSVAILQNRPVLLTYVEDRQAFESSVIERARKTLKIEAPVQSEQISGQTVKFASQSPGLDIAWFYNGKLAVIALPAFKNTDALDNGTALVVASQLLGLDKKSSVQSSESYQRFHKALGNESTISAYFNTDALLKSKALENSQKELRDGAAAALEWGKNNTRGFGLALATKSDQIQLKFFLDPTEEFAKAAAKATTQAAKSNWENFATENTLIGMRSSVDFQQLWKGYLDSLSDQQRRSLQRELQMAGKDYGIDIEADVFAGLTGNSALFFYGVDLGTLMSAQQDDFFQLIRAFGLITAVQLNNKNNLEGLIQKVNTAAQGILGLRHLVNEDGEPDKSIKVLEVKNLATTPGRVYIKDDLVAFASGAFDETSVAQYFDGSRKEAKLKDVQTLDLGKRFATEKDFNGLYVNFIRAADHLGSAIPMPIVKQTLSQMEELLIDVTVNDKGIFTTVTLDLAPTP